MAVQSSYYNLTLPFIGQISEGLRDGMTVQISGSVEPSSDGFQIDFQCGLAPFPQSDIAFEFNPRFNQDCVVWNSYEKGSWQQEGRIQAMPFRKGDPFEILFCPTSSFFKVTVNGKHFLDFQHRIPFSRVNAIAICGGVKVAAINFQGPAV